MKYKINFLTSSSSQKTLVKTNKNDLNKILKYVVKDINSKDSYEVSLSLCSSEEIRRLNLQYRVIDKTTDVLSFPQEFKHQGKVDLGDIFINAEILASQAQEIGSDQNMELKFLFLHGLLHLIGYDHQTKAEEELMINKQKEVLLNTKIRNY